MELFKLLGTVAIENDQAIKALDDTSKQASVTQSETADAFSKIGGVAAGIGKAVVTAGVAIGGAWLAAIEGSREYRTEMGKLDAAFVSNGHSSEAAKQTYSDLNAVLGDGGQAVEAAQHLAKLTDNEKDLQTWTDICTGVYATFGESLPIEGLTEAANETAKTGILTGGLTDALNWAGISEEKFQEKLDACSNEQERQKLIMDTLNGTYSKASDQYKKTNKDVMDAQKAQEKLTDAFASLGAVGEPILTAIKEKVAEMVSAAVPHIENFVQKVKDISQWVKENRDTIDQWVAVIIGAGTAIGTFLLILNWGTIMTTAANAVKVVRTAILGMNAAILANPIALIVALIVGLVAAFIYLWNNVEGFRKFWINAWKKIKEIASDAGKAIAKFFSEAWKSIKKAWSSVTSFFQGIWKGITKIYANVKSWFADRFRQAWNGIKSAWNGAKSFFSGIWSSVTKTFGNVAGWFRGKFQSAWSSIKSVFSSWGSFFGGLWTKIKSKFGSIGSSLGKAMGDSVKSAMNKVLSTIEKAINKGIGLINSAIGLANKLPGINAGKVSKVSLPRLEQGGVLERGQIGLLEGTGAEAVVPLENNRAWLSKVAEDLNELQGGSSRNGSNNEITSLLNRAIDLLEDITRMKIFLDSGAMVGELVPAIDVQLSDRFNHSKRGNTR
jgi:phage-related protein